MWVEGLKKPGELVPGEQITWDFTWQTVTHVHLEGDINIFVELPPLLSLNLGALPGDKVQLTLESGQILVWRANRNVLYRYWQE